VCPWTGEIDALMSQSVETLCMSKVSSVDKDMEMRILESTGMESLNGQKAEVVSSTRSMKLVVHDEVCVLQD
jgi:predicted esterase YcpF (UPF0227 family)